MAQKYDILYVNFYTDGSAARKVSPAAPATQPRKKPVAKRQQKTVIYLDPVAVCSIMMAAVLLVFMAIGLTQFQNARAEAQAMEAYVEKLSAEKEALSQDFYDSVDLDSVEKTAVALGTPLPSPATNTATARMALTQEPVTSCPMGLVRACRVTSRASSTAVSVIQRIFLFIKCILFSFLPLLMAYHTGVGSFDADPR